jgi:CYTH domain-containing protein
MHERRYAIVEDEQRFVLAAVPGDAVDPRTIEDRYVLGTRLRLRSVRTAGGEQRKLGHKVPFPDRPSAVWHTSLYLDEAEFALLAALPAATLAKRRYTVAPGSVDEFLGDLEGLVLLEGDRPVDVGARGVEVTDDERFRGGALAGLDPAAARALVAEARRMLP